MNKSRPNNMPIFSAFYWPGKKFVCVIGLIGAIWAIVFGSNVFSKNTNIEVNGVMSPGNSPGCFESSGNLTYSSTATLIVEIGGLQPCSEYDQVSAEGTITINNSSLKLELFGQFVPVIGDSFQVLSAAQFSGLGFASIDFSAASLPAGLRWDTSDIDTVGVLRVIVAETAKRVPLPPFALIILALAVLFVGQRIHKEAGN